jgi:hypothetical protein
MWMGLEGRLGLVTEFKGLDGAARRAKRERVITKAAGGMQFNQLGRRWRDGLRGATGFNICG